MDIAVAELGVCPSHVKAVEQNNKACELVDRVIAVCKLLAGRVVAVACMLAVSVFVHSSWKVCGHCVHNSFRAVW